MTEQQRSGDTSNAGRQMVGPGRLVRDARLRRDMTVDQVAEALHLDRRTVEQLEADDFDALPPLTFVRGYLRAYCHLLELDPEPVINRLAEAGITDSENPLKAHAGAEAGDTRTPRPVSRGPGFLGLALGLALLIAGVVAAGWWLSRSELSIPFIAPADEQTGAAAADSAAQNASPADTSMAPTPDPATDPASDDGSMTQAPSDTPSTGTGSPEPAAEAMESASGTALAAPEVEPSPATGAMAETDEGAADVSGDRASGEESPAVVPEAPAAEPDQLVFRFSGDSWMEVTDDRGERLLFGMAEPGEERLTGRAPFDIVIGNTRNVTLRYGDEEVDLEQYARGNVARFTLGGS